MAAAKGGANGARDTGDQYPVKGVGVKLLHALKQPNGQQGKHYDKRNEPARSLPQAGYRGNGGNVLDGGAVIHVQQLTDAFQMACTRHGHDALAISLANLFGHVEIAFVNEHFFCVGQGLAKFFHQFCQHILLAHGSKLFFVQLGFFKK